MSENLQLSATSREAVGKANRRLSGSGTMPAVVYGTKHPAQAIAVDRHTFELLSRREGLTSSLVKLSVDDQEPLNVIVKSIQRDPVKGTILHADFWAVSMDQKISAAVPIHFVGDSPGVKSGGIMTHSLQQVTVEALPADLPDYLEADISALEVGDSLPVSSLAVPPDVTVLSPAEETLCSVLAPKALEEEVVEEEVEVLEEGEEPQVVGEEAEAEE